MIKSASEKFAAKIVPFFVFVSLIFSGISAPAHAEDDHHGSSIVANAGRDQHVALGDLVVLDASKSTSADGALLNYSWTILSKPAGSHALLSNAQAIRPSFVADVPGDFVFVLRAGSQSGHDESDHQNAQAQVTISTNQVRPVADAGLNRATIVGATLALDGSRSSDADGNAISYQWRLIQRPAGSNTALSSPSSVRPKLTIDRAGSYIAELVVTDSKGQSSAPSRVVVGTKAALAPRPSAGPAQLVPVKASARIDADGTYSPYGNLTNASWALIGAPNSSLVALTVASDARETLTPDISGDYVVQVGLSGVAAAASSDDDDHCEDDHGAMEASRFATVLISTNMVPPVANAGREQRVNVGGNVTLSGARSTNVNGHILSYRWALLSKPANSAAVLSAASVVEPTFTADIAGDYVAQLIVADGSMQSDPVSVVISTVSNAPAADAGPDVLAKPGSAAVLNGTGSSDPHGDALTAKWSILGLGDQLTGTLSAPDKFSTNFNVPVAGVPLNQAIFAGPAVVALAQSDFDDHANPALQLSAMGTAVQNAKTYSVWRVRNATHNGLAATLASAQAGFSLAVNVPANSDLYVASPVIGQHILSVTAKIPARVNTSAVAFNDTRLVGGGPALKLSIVQLLASNALYQDYDDVVVSTLEARPVAIPLATGSFYRGVAFTLDGATSINPNRPTAQTTGLTYRWAILSRPAGSTAALVNANTANPSLTADIFGTYIVQLVVSDGILESRPKTLVLNTLHRLPVAAVSGGATATVGQIVNLSGAGSIDPDGNPLIYLWTLTTPSGSQSVLSSNAAVAPSFKPDVAGNYTAQLVVSDAFGASAPASVTIAVQGGGLAFAPVASPATVALGSSLSFTLHATDPSGKPVTYSLQNSTLPAGASFNTASGLFSFRPTSASPSSYNFSFAASNGTATVTQTVTVNITGVPVGTTSGLSANVYDAVDYAAGKLTPVSGVIVSAGSVSSTSNSAGLVSLAGLTAGKNTLTISAISAQKAPDGSTYAGTYTSATLIAGVVNTLDAPILLARSSGGTAINPAGATTITNPALNVSLTVQPGSAFNPDGSVYTGAVSIDSLPVNTAILPDGFSACQLLTIAPVGVTFNPPAQLTVANTDALPANSNVDLWAFDTNLSAARVVGIGVVSADGKTITTAVGGVPGGTILAMMPHRAAVSPVALQPADIFVPNILGGGDLASSFSPPGSRELNTGRGLSFIYHSSTASPRPIVNETATLTKSTGIPASVQSRLIIGGTTQSTIVTTNTAAPLNPATPALNNAQNNALLQAGIADAAALPSGQYNFRFLTLSKFACSVVAGQSQGSLIVNNQSASPMGAGWQLAELQKLNIQPDGSALVVEGTGRAVSLKPEQAPSFVPDPVYIPVSGPHLGATADLLGDGNQSLVRLGWKDGSLNVILNKGNRQFSKIQKQIISLPGTANADGSVSVDAPDIAAGNIRGGGDVDLAIATFSTQQAKILYGVSGGTFSTTPVTVEGNAGGGAIAIGDWNGDGAKDLIWAEGGANHSFPDLHPMYQDPATGTIGFQVNGQLLPGTPVSIKTVRFPGEAYDSFVYVGDDGTLGFVNPQFNTRDAAEKLTIPTAVSLRGGRILASADIDNSGRPSFAVAGAHEVYIVKWYRRGQGNQQIVQTVSLPNGLSPDSVTLAPLAKGNKPSLIVTANTAGFYVYPNDGKGGFGQPVFIATPFRVGIQADVADFDNDGYADIALNDLDNDRVAIFFGKANPTGAFVAPIGDYTKLVTNADGSLSRVYNDGTVVAFNGTGFQTAITDPNGNKTSYTYNGQGQLISIVDATGAITNMTYAGAFLASSTDAQGRTTSYVHDASGNLTKITDPLGNVTQYLYDANHLLIATIDPNSKQSSNIYNATGQLQGQSYADGTSVMLDVTKSLGLDALGVSLNGPSTTNFVPAEARISLMQDAAGNQSETEVNEYGAVVRVTDALGRTSTFTRDAANRVTTSHIPAGISTGAGAPTANGLPTLTPSDTLETLYTYDSAGSLTSTLEGGSFNGAITQPRQRTNLYSYEPTHNRLASKTDAAGFTTLYAYDSNGNMLSTTDALGHVTGYTYDTRGLKTSETDANGNVTGFTYDANGNLARTTDAIGSNFDRYYDASGNLILSIDGVGTPVERRNSWHYDSNNRQISATSATGQVTSQTYDAAGNITRFTDAAGNVTSRVYDSLNRLVSETTPDSGTSTTSYDANGNVSATADAAGATTTYAYDAANRLTGMTDALGGVKAMSYDLRNNMASLKDARGKLNSFTYDVFNRLKYRYDPDHSQPWDYNYDIRDNLAFVNTPSGESDTMAYDALNRRIGAGGRGYTYDAAGNLTALKLNEFYAPVISYSYDALNRVSAAQLDAFRNDTFKTTYTYDALGRRASMADNYGATTLYSFDAEDRLTAITTPWGGVITQSYDAAGRPLRLSYPNGLDADLSFEANTGRLAGIQHRAGSLAAPIASYTHSYDLRGNLATLSELGGTKTYSYDKLERLTGVSAAAPLETYTYDAEGNRTSTATQPSIITDDANRVLDDGVNTYTWDAKGALLTRTPKANPAAALTFNHSWQGADNQARLDSVTGAFNYQFTYDPLFRLWGINNSGSQTWRLHDGQDMVLEHRDIGTPNDRWARYVHGPGTDDVLAMELYPVGALPNPGTGSIYFYHKDAEGSVRLLTDASGAVANSYLYDSFGKKLTSVESAPQTYAWKGRDFIQGADIYFNRARWFDPQLGRFIEEDPIGLNSASINRYVLGWNNPKRWNDSLGLSAEEDASAAGVGASAAVPMAATGAKIACAIGTVAAALSVSEDPSLGAVVAMTVDAAACSVSVLRARGLAAEAKVGITQAKQMILIEGRKRFPDEINAAAKTIKEVKDVAYQAYTSQLRDYAKFAKDNGYIFYLYVYKNSVRLTNPLKKAIEQGLIKLQGIP